MRVIILLAGLFAALTGATLAHAAEKAAAQSIAAYFKQIGAATKRQTFYNAARTQRVEYFCTNDNTSGEKRANSRCTAVLFVKQAGDWVYGDEVDLGHGAVLGFSANTLKTRELEYGPDDPDCCPSVATPHIFNTQSGKLVVDKAAEETAQENAPVTKSRK